MKLGNETEKDSEKKVVDKKDNEDEEADFERDEVQEDVENVKEDEGGDSDQQKSSQRLIRNVSVKIYTKKGQGKKKRKTKKSKKKQPEEPKPPPNPNLLMDVLFAFIGVSSTGDNSDVLKS